MDRRNTDWVVYAKRPFTGSEAVFVFLGIGFVAFCVAVALLGVWFMIMRSRRRKPNPKVIREKSRL
jgi:hypothetical protein